jgi:4-diphosphocytidyl-2C-methyl-D-erythritol kinase
MPTQDAFRRIAEARGGDYRPRSFRLSLDDLATWDGIAAIAANDFGLVAGEALPRLGGAIAALREEGALISLLAGSGASVFGIFAEAEPLLRAEGILRAMGFATWRCHTLEAMPNPRRSPAGTA